MKAYTEFVDYIVAGLTPQNILAFRPSEEKRERVRCLLSAEKANSIMQEGKAELDDFEQFERLMRIAKARATQHGTRG